MTFPTLFASAVHPLSSGFSEMTELSRASLCRNNDIQSSTLPDFGFSLLQNQLSSGASVAAKKFLKSFETQLPMHLVLEATCVSDEDEWSHSTVQNFTAASKRQTKSCCT
ncbi:hypothetical protein NPIL_219091 [Nephila pilipes]|uniref:Uncharacterized protein n=1 Tax=Nephila pilipes TaxID=299642 RepID=A0A8X6TPD9_NEPPI|nr:hypothetical protein NPIL_219091 [Nephila pilipes]